MRMTIDARMLEHSGIGIYLKNLLLRLKNSPFEISLIISKNLFEKYSWLSSFQKIFSEAPIYSLQEQITLPLLIPKCDLFWSPHFNVPLFPIRARKRIVTVHDLFHLAFFSELSFPQKIYAKNVIPKAIKSSDHIITVSHFSKQEILKFSHAPEDKISVIYSGSDHLETASNQKYDLPEKYLLFVGNAKPHKNLKRLLEAFEQLSQNIQLVIVGKQRGFIHGIDLEKLIKNSSAANRIHCLENIDDQRLAALYQSAQALILPSFYEGFGLPAVEAMRIGCPVIASKAASLPEVCDQCAHYIDPYDSQDIFKGIQEMLNNQPLRKQLITDGKKRAEGFLWKNSIEKHIEVFKHVS